MARTRPALPKKTTQSNGDTADASRASAQSVAKSEANAATLTREIAWFTRVLEARLSIYFKTPCEVHNIEDYPPPDVQEDDSPYARVIKECAMGLDERLILILALLPNIRPQALDMLFIRNKNVDRGFSEFGGWSDGSHGGFMPTCETAAFILAGEDLVKRFKVSRYFEDEHFFTRLGILRLEAANRGEPILSSALRVSANYLMRLTTGTSHKPDYSINFPAKRITTVLSWDDLVLPVQVLEDVENVKTWLRHSATILDSWGLEKTLKPGYRSLFYGPPGTGKTLTAMLIGATVGVDVYRIDLSMMVSKYIGETEKNLARVFDQAQNRNWILFFDEADSLFGKRTQTASANDRYANQEISYLLQRVEDFPGVVILATNLKANIDDAFARRFQSLVYFPLPDVEQRLRLWRGMLSDKNRLARDVSLEKVAEDYELSGGAISNVVRFGVISALQRNDNVIRQHDLVTGIAKERRKEGKTI